MSVSASLGDLGAVAVKRTSPAPKSWAERSGAGEDDAFGRMLRDAARDPNDKTVRDAERHEPIQRQNEPGPGKHSIEDRRERSDAAAEQWAEHRRDDVRNDGKPHGRTGDSRTEGANDTGKPAAATAEDGPERVELAQSTASPDPTASENPLSEPAPAPAIQAVPTTTDNATQNAVAEALVLVAAAPAQSSTANAAPGDEVEAGETPAAPSATTGAPAAPPSTPAALVAAAQLLTETAPTAVGGEKRASDATEVAAVITAVSAKSGSIIGRDGLPLVATPPSTTGEAGAAPQAGTLPETAAAALSKQQASQTGEAAKNFGNAGEVAGLEKNAASPSGQPATSQASVAAAAATLDVVRGAVMENQSQANAVPAQGLAQAISATSASDARVPQPAQAPQRHEIPVPMQAVAIEIGMRAMRGAKEFAIRLDPEDLGRIDVKLEVSEAGQVQAKVVVEKVETLQLLQRDARTLERAFDQAGLKTSPDGLQFSLRDPGSQGRHNDEQTPRNSGGGGSQKTDEPMIDEIRLKPMQYRLAGNGGLDIRI